MAAGPFWKQTPAAAAAGLGCGVDGLTSADAAARLAKYGRNADAQAPEAGLIVSVGRRLLEPMCLILIAAAVVSAATGDAPSAVIILVILNASVALDTVQEGSAKRAAEALRQSVALKAEVKRDGAFSPSTWRPSFRATCSAWASATSSRPTPWCWNPAPSPSMRRR